MFSNGPTPARIAWVIPRATANALVKPTALRNARSLRGSVRWRAYRPLYPISRCYASTQSADDQRLDLARFRDPHQQAEAGVEHPRSRQRDPDGQNLGDQCRPEDAVESLPEQVSDRGDDRR